VFFVLSSLCVWWCPIHIALCFLLCPRYVYGGVLYILHCVFCFVLVMCMVVSYTYCIVFFALFSLFVWWCPMHIVLCFMFCLRYVYGGVLYLFYCVFFVLVMCMVVFYTLCIGHHHTHSEDKEKTQYNMHRTPPYI
jgi:hypothetical protein